VPTLKAMESNLSENTLPNLLRDVIKFFVIPIVFAFLVVLQKLLGFLF